MTMRFDNEHRESPESVQSALRTVRANGDKRKRVRRTAGGAVGLVAVAGIATASLTGGAAGPTLASPDTTPATQAPAISLVAQVTERAANALTTTTSYSASADLVYRYQGEVYSQDNLTFTIADDGSFRTERTEVRNGVSFTSRDSWDHSTGISTGCTEDYCAQQLQAPMNPSPFFEFTSAIAAATDDNATISEVTDNGYDTYRLDISTFSYETQQPRNVVVNIDRETGLPVKMVSTTSSEGKSYNDLEVTITGLEVDPDVTAAELQVQMQADLPVYGANVKDPDKTYGDTVRAGLEDELPMTTIDGFGGTKVITQTNAIASFGSCVIKRADGSIDPDKGTATFATQIGHQGTLAYTAQVLDRAACSNPLNKSDIFAEGMKSTVVKTFVPTSGALAGADLEILRTQTGDLILFGQNDDYVVNASGDLTEAQLVELANNYEL